MPHTVCLIPGDGIGPEVTSAAKAVLAAAGAQIEWIEVAAGAGAVEKFGDTLPKATLDALETHRLALKGPLATPVGTGYTSINVTLRKKFCLYAAVRPIRSMPGVKTRRPCNSAIRSGTWLSRSNGGYLPPQAL